MALQSPEHLMAGSLAESIPDHTLLAALVAVHFRFTLAETAKFRFLGQDIISCVEPGTRLEDITPASESPSLIAINSGLQISRVESAGPACLYYDPDIYDAATAHSIWVSVGDVINNWNASHTVADLHFPSAHALLDRLGAVSFPELPYPKDTGIGDLFHNTATQYAQLVALISDNSEQKITYAELDAQSNMVAKWALSLLHTLDASDGQHAIAVWSENSIHYPIVVLGILKAGLAILPLDPRTPRSRVETILEDRRLQQPCIPIISPGNTNTAPFADMGYPLYELSDVLKGSWPGAELRGHAGGLTLAFYCYTSGSTGRPKGLMINHHTIARVAKSAFFASPSPTHIIPRTPVTRPEPGQVWMNLSNNAWLFAHVEMFTPLLNGASSLPIPHERVIDLPLLSATFIRRNVNVGFMVPALVAALCREHPEALTNVSMIVLSGDIATIDDVRTARKSFKGHLVNSYGSSETHFTSGFAVPIPDASEVESDGLPGAYRRLKSVPVGRPWSNMGMYVLDSHQRLVPPGMIGTMYIASEVLARGYTEERLDEAFYPASKISKAWGLTPSPEDRRRFFRSSDQARWLCATGQLEYMGRNDTEVNIRGQRVDLAGVDHALRKSIKILDAVTVIQHDPQGAALLVSFVVPKFDAKVNKAGDLAGAEQSPTDVWADVGDSIEFETKLKDAVSAILPSFMIPSFIVPLSQFPQTITGKIDRKALTSWTHLVDYARDADGSTTVGGDESTSAVEEIIIEIFKEVLQRKQVRADNSFFHLGGHSLLATQVISRIRKALGVDDRLTVRALFDAPTAGALAQLVESLQDQDCKESNVTPAIAISYQPIERLRAQDSYTLSYAQERLYFLDLLHPGQTGYIIPHVLRIGGTLDIQALRAAFHRLRQRHEMLRVTYEDNHGVIVQRIHACDEQELLVVDLTLDAKPDDTLRKMLQADNDASLDLHKDLPLRFKLYRLGPDTHVLWMALHHLSTDAWSDRVIQRELGQLYAAYHTGLPANLPDLPITYMDYAAWQRQPDQSVQQEEQLKYWVDTLQGSVPAEFPTDFVRPSALSARAAPNDV